MGDSGRSTHTTAPRLFFLVLYTCIFSRAGEFLQLYYILYTQTQTIYYYCRRIAGKRSSLQRYSGISVEGSHNQRLHCQLLCAWRVLLYLYRVAWATTALYNTLYSFFSLLLLLMLMG